MDLRTALNTLLAHPAFAELERRLRDLTLFGILGIERRELSHAALLRWLLDPHASHGLGTAPLSTFMTVAYRLGGHPNRIDAIALDGLELNTAEVTAERSVATKVKGKPRRGRLDVCVELPTPAGDRPVLLIEYKVDSGESGDQTAVYAEWAKEHLFPTERGERWPLLVYLTPSSADEPAKPFEVLSYDDFVPWLLDIAGRARDSRTKLLLTELARTLGQRGDVADEVEDGLVNSLNSDCAAAIRSLRSASSTDLSPFRGILRQHDEVFSRLEARPSPRASKGRSAFVVHMREHLNRHMREGVWRPSTGLGSYQARWLPLRGVVEALPVPEGARSAGDLRLVYWMNRPAKQTARIVIELVGGLKALGEAAQQKKLREALATSLRPRVLEAVAEAQPGRGNIAAYISMAAPGVNTPDDDTDNKVPAFVNSFDQVAAFNTVVEGVLDGWLPEAERIIGAALAGV